MKNLNSISVPLFQQRRSVSWAFLLLAFCWSGCSTDKNTLVTRSYHNLTCHYNGWFWGNLSFEEGYKKLVDNHHDDFSDILPVFVYAQDKEVQTVYPEMDRAIKKATTMIENHTITTKDKREIPDAVKYIKYCYLLLAKAKLYKNEDVSAIESLDYASKEYRKTSVKYEALMWEARAYNKIAAISKSEEIIDLLKSAKDISKKIYAPVCATVADYYALSGEREEMKKWLLKAVTAEHKKSVKSRYYFILGQLAAKEGDKQKAYDYYSTVLKMNPPYELDFEAHISRAVLNAGRGKGNQEMKKELMKMLKPTKNIDNRDQIYYALAQVSENEGDTDQAVKYLNKSVRSSTTNATQKAVSYLSLADINFLATDYPRSKKYFDSTLRSLPKNYKGRDSIVDKRDNLQRLVKYLDIIAVDDSLLRLSKMSQTDLDKYIDGVIAREKAETEKRRQKEKEAEQNELSQLSNNPVNNNPVNSGSNNSWYFYNPGQMQLGLTEFLQKWGSRPLEDNWRRSRKAAEIQQNSPLVEGTGKTGSDTVKEKLARRKDSIAEARSRASYLKNVPKNESQLKAMNDSLVEAYYNAGSIYKEYLRNYGRAAGEFEELLNRYPENKYKLITYYSLYRTYETTGNTERMNYYKNILLTKYPNTEYAQLIANPEKYRQNQQASREEMQRLYASALQSYQEEKFSDVLSACLRADSLYPKNPYAPKFAYLEAAGIGYTQGLEAYKNALTRVTILYPKDSVKFLAESTLAILNKMKAPPPKKDTTAIPYSLDKDSLYSFIVLVDNKQAPKVNELRNAITDMNSKSFSQDNLRVENMMLDNDHQIVKVGIFTTTAKATDYFGFVNGNVSLFKSFNPGSYQTFYISDKNFQMMMRHGNADAYIQFFKDKMK